MSWTKSDIFHSKSCNIIWLCERTPKTFRTLPGSHLNQQTIIHPIWIDGQLNVRLLYVQKESSQYLVQAWPLQDVLTCPVQGNLNNQQIIQSKHKRNTMSQWVRTFLQCYFFSISALLCLLHFKLSGRICRGKLGLFSQGGLKLKCRKCINVIGVYTDINSMWRELHVRTSEKNF